MVQEYEATKIIYNNNFETIQPKIIIIGPRGNLVKIFMKIGQL